MTQLPANTRMHAIAGQASWRRRLAALLILAWTLTQSGQVLGHGSVVDEGDACVIQFGFYSAHFSIFQPEATGHQGFCEDIPNADASVFVMEYRHDSMRQVPLEFRIMHNNSGLGRFVRWQDIAGMTAEQLSADTVFLQSLPAQPDGVARILHDFESTGDYIGIVSIPHPSDDILYHAVFPFRVGASVWSNWPLGLPILALLWFAVRRRGRRSQSSATGVNHEAT
ncbi:hypothetical protein [Pseudohongiella sp.]|uniref:Uncharacterized protein n=1 Tax=marine sediment metagenome TaxID=412755 RepID=A0A0F9V1K0_9ZZZZ|nr:hypothetical protein [Pseudohongiella sp.]HDZ08901.1 hypothetical protein [Pseudohongiella sp.]HEA64021.1 hypothetical protein [Pseudohongiella sp.]